MSRTLTSDNSTAITNGFPGKNFVHMMEITTTATTLTDANWGCVAGVFFWTRAHLKEASTNYKPFISEMSDITEQFGNIITNGGGVASGSSFSFRMPNTERNGSNFVNFCEDNDVTIEGSEVKVLIYLDKLRVFPRLRNY